jgi:hypothetical protein
MQTGNVKSISGLEEALKVPGIDGIFLNIKEGDLVVMPRSNVEKSGNIIASGNTLTEAEDAITRCFELLKIETTDDSEITMARYTGLSPRKIQKDMLCMQKLRRHKLRLRSSGHGWRRDGGIIPPEFRSP